MLKTKQIDLTLLPHYRSYLVIDKIAYFGMSVHLSLVLLFYFLNSLPLALLNVISTLIWLLSWNVNRQRKHELAIAMMLGEIFLHTVIVVPAVGWSAGFQYYLFGAIPFSLFNNKFNEKIIVLISIALWLTFIVLDSVMHDVPNVMVIAEPVIQAVNFANIGVSFTAVALISFYFRLASTGLEQRLVQLANTDPLTGLYNRRRMQEILEIQRSLTSRSGLCFTIIFVDIDHFKRFNDTFGHSCGDYVLREVAAFMKNHLRMGDVISRWGGEEFLMMLPDTDIKGARVIAEKIRRGVAEKQFQFGGHSFSVTLTLGLTQHEQLGSIDDSLKRADHALYQGKEAGRNLVIG